MADYIARLDAQLDQLLAGWNIYTTLVALVLVTFVVYPIFFSQEPDTHPLLLSRQANVSPIRQPGESATHRSLETPIGYPLKAGLDIKEQGASRWSSGKNGDMRDIWRRAVRGPQNENGESTSPTGKILTVYGSEEVEAHDLNAVSRDINNIGSYIKEQGGNHVAIYLPNSIELLVVIFGMPSSLTCGIAANEYLSRYFLRFHSDIDTLQPISRCHCQAFAHGERGFSHRLCRNDTIC